MFQQTMIKYELKLFYKNKQHLKATTNKLKVFNLISFGIRVSSVSYINRQYKTVRVNEERKNIIFAQKKKRAKSQCISLIMPELKMTV